MELETWKGISVKKFIVLISMAFVALSGVAYAAQTTTVRGTQHRDVIRTGNGGETIVYGLGGNDSLHGGRGTDIMYGGRGDDRVWTGAGGAKEVAYGGPGNDRINDWWSGESPGYLNGGRGRDVCVGDKHDTFISCEKVIWK